MRILRAGGNLQDDFLKNNPKIFEDETKKVVARRLKVTPDKVEMNGDQLKNWSEQQLGSAYNRISQGAQAVNNYFQR